MRNYLFIDLHIHSIYSFENACDSTPEDILHNALETSQVIKRAMIKRVENCENNGDENGIDNLIREFSPYFAENKEEQEHIQGILLNSQNKATELKNYIENYTKCCISITDHQNVQGSKVAMDLIKKHPQKYSAIDFVSGIEINTGLKCLGTNSDKSSIFKKCHSLAYGYNIYDKTLNAFSQLFNFTTNKIDDTTIYKKPIEIGKMVLWAKRRVDEITGDKIPIGDLAFIAVNTQSYLHAKNKFYSYLKSRYPTRNFRNEKSVENCFIYTGDGNDKAINGAKWEIDELMRVIKNANGYFSLAHPYKINKRLDSKNDIDYFYEFVDALIKATNDESFQELKTISQVDKKEIKDKIKSINSKYGKHYLVDEIYQIYISFTFGKDIEEFVQKVLTLRNNEKFGLEIFNKLNLSGAKSKVLYDIAKKYNLYLTGGSDHHGPNLHPENTIARCFDKKFIYSDDDLFTVDENILQKEIDKANSLKVNNTLNYMPFVGLVKNKQKFKERQKIYFYNRQKGTLRLDKSLFDRHKTWIVKPDWTVKSIKKYLNTTGFDHISRKDFEFLKKDGDGKLSDDGGIGIV